MIIINLHLPIKYMLSKCSLDHRCRFIEMLIDNNTIESFVYGGCSHACQITNSKVLQNIYNRLDDRIKDCHIYSIEISLYDYYKNGLYSYKIKTIK